VLCPYTKRKEDYELWAAHVHMCPSPIILTCKADVDICHAQECAPIYPRGRRDVHHARDEGPAILRIGTRCLKEDFSRMQEMFEQVLIAAMSKLRPEEKKRHSELSGALLYSMVRLLVSESSYERRQSGQSTAEKQQRRGLWHR
jgi:hypothetical protein